MDLTAKRTAKSPHSPGRSGTNGPTPPSRHVPQLNHCPVRRQNPRVVRHVATTDDLVRAAVACRSHANNAPDVVYRCPRCCWLVPVADSHNGLACQPPRNRRCVRWGGLCRGKNSNLTRYAQHSNTGLKFPHSRGGYLHPSALYGEQPGTLRPNTGRANASMTQGSTAPEP